MTIAWVDPASGALLVLTSEKVKGPKGRLIAVKGPPGAVAVREAPENGKQVWNFATQSWSPPPAPPAAALTTGELAEVLKTKGVIADNDLPQRVRGRPVQRGRP